MVTAALVAAGEFFPQEGRKTSVCPSSQPLPS